MQPTAITRDHDDALTWLPGWRIRELIVDGEVSPTEVVEHFLARIEALDPGDRLDIGTVSARFEVE